MNNRMEAALKRMDELQIAFIAKLGDKVKELSRLILQLDGNISDQNEHNQQLLEKIHALSHNLAGSAGTFKHTAVYNKAKAIEHLSGNVLNQTHAPSHWHRLLLEFVVGLRGDIQVSGRPAIVEKFSSTMMMPEKNSTDSLQPHYPVIVVDDDELLVNLIKEQAKHFEYNVIPLLTTEDLEAAIDKYQPTAILIDVIFPDAKHSGIEIINQLKAKSKINCPVIFMSNRCDVAVRLDALRAGSNAYIVKPLDILELIRVLDRLTKKLTKKKSRILIVDDDSLSAQFYQTALIDCGFLCEIVTNPMDVINVALSFTPDAILLDINMPGCSGFELAEILRQDDSFSHIPLLFLTVAYTREQEILAMKSGGDDFLDKNAELSSLIAIIKGHIQRYKELDSLLTRLKRDEIRFRSVSSSSSDAIISTDEKGRIVFWNEGAENIFKFSALETIGQPLDFIIPADQRKKHILCFETDKPQELLKHSIERAAITKDKNLIDIELTYTEWISGHEKFYTAIIRDISRRKKIEQELLHKEAYLDAIINSSGEAIITTNSEGIIETANPKAAQIFGYHNGELLGQNVSVLIPTPQKEQHHQCMQHSELYAPRIINHARELNGMRKDGSLFALELNVSPMNIAGEKKFVGILHDISNRKQFVNELLLAKAGAEAASKAKTQFLSNMSHELRTPLNAILGFAQLLQADSEHFVSAEQFDSLQHIYNAGMRLLTLVNDVLNLSKIEEGALELKNEKFELVEFTNEIIHQIKHLATTAGMTLDEFNTDSPAFVVTDKAKLNIVINQLLSNAIKYNNPHGTIKVFLTPLDNKIRLSVTDTGKGIPASLQPELFKPFSRLGAEGSQIEGTGIGLALAKKLMEIMQGEIGVISQVNEGSTFWIELERLVD